MSNIQEGLYCSVHPLETGGIEKVSLRAHSEPEARRLVGALSLYADQLDAEPIAVAGILGVDVLSDEDGYRVRHVTERIDGPSLSELTGAEREEQLRLALNQIAGMATFSDGETLHTPIDGLPRNFHVDGSNGPTLIDLYPPLARRPDGSIPLENIGAHDAISLIEGQMGQKTGVIVRMLAHSAPRAEGKWGRLRRAVRERDDWCYDVLPDNLTGPARDRVRAMISRRFLPVIVREAVVRRVNKLARLRP
jgi:hypothetical protein